jgi:hypothetical protein
MSHGFFQIDNFAIRGSYFLGILFLTITVDNSIAATKVVIIPGCSSGIVRVEVD